MEQEKIKPIASHGQTSQYTKHLLEEHPDTGLGAIASKRLKTSHVKIGDQMFDAGRASGSPDKKAGTGPTGSEKRSTTMDEHFKLSPQVEETRW